MIKGLFEDKGIKKKISLLLICIVLLSISGGGVYYYVHYSIKVPSKLSKASLEKMKSSDASLLAPATQDIPSESKDINKKPYYTFSDDSTFCEQEKDGTSVEKDIAKGEIISENTSFKGYASFVGTHTDDADYSVYYFSDKNECEQAGKSSFLASKTDKEEMEKADKEKKTYLEEGAVKFVFSLGPKESHTPCIETTQNIYEILNQQSGDRGIYKKEKLPYIGKYESELGLDGDGVSYLTLTNFFYSNKEGCEAALKKRLKKK